MRRFTVMGFTEAELGFVIAALFAALTVVTVNDSDVKAGSLQDEADTLRAELNNREDELARTREELRKANEKIAELVDKVSTKIPQCWEKGESREALGELTVLGEDRYRLDGEVVSLDTILSRYMDRLDKGKVLGCRFVLIARPSAEVNAVVQSSAVWRLRNYFDVDDRAR